MTAERTAEVSPPGPAHKFGTFLGVFTPSVLTIVGVIMYLRFAWMVGNVGLGLSLLIVLLASGITVITALSASAVATNMRVGVGGEYYMISRSLGPELGGAIGIPLFMCRTLSLTLYSFGLAESILGHGHAALPWLAGGIIVVITAISGKSARASLRLQIPIMIAVGLSLVALVVGVLTGPLRAAEWTPPFLDPSARARGFWYVFAIFFPAVTGFTAGIGMSGDLKDPRRSIPRGTIAAVLVGTIIYLAVPVFLAFTDKVSRGDLAQMDARLWTRVALLGSILVFPGMWGAILSSAFGSALGGPRVL